MFLRWLISSFTLGLWLLFTGYAQQAGPDGAASREKQVEQEALEQKAFALLEEIIAQAPTLKLVENRVMIQATAAGLIWKQDEKQARTVFKAAIAGLAEITSAMDQSDPQYDGAAQTISELRLNLLDVITQFDPQLALDFLHATRQPSPPRRHSSYSPQHDYGLYRRQRRDHQCDQQHRRRDRGTRLIYAQGHQLPIKLNQTDKL
jgi:hypothetical protein